MPHHEPPTPNPITEILILLAAATVLLCALLYAFPGGN
jgi:hypothetical protein